MALHTGGVVCGHACMEEQREEDREGGRREGRRKKRESVCVCVCEREREREKGRERLSLRELVSVSPCETQSEGTQHSWLYRTYIVAKLII